MKNNSYKPALRFHWLTRFYDSLLNITFPERKIKDALIQQAAFKRNEKVLDFGVGTATLSIMMQQLFPSLQVTGLDVDAKILSIAKEKIARNNLPIHLQQYDGEHFPFDNNSFGKVLSSLVFHHLPTSVKTKVLKEIFRVLQAGGELHIADFGKPRNWYSKLAFGIFRRMDGEENTRVNARGQLPSFISDAGFSNIQETIYFNTAFGTVMLIKAVKHAS